jgi:enoyl-CoA hydratase
MEQMLTGDAMSGIEAARVGFANRAYPVDELEERVLEIAQRITTIPTDIVQINKRTVRRAMDNMGMRASIRAGTELCGLAMHTEAFQSFLRERETSLTAALTKRDSPFGDYRTSDS